MLTRNQERREREMQKTHTDEFKTFTEIVKGYMCLFETMHNPGWHDKNKADIKVETVYVLFNYLMLEKTKKIISGPEYERYRKVMLNKVKQLKNEANTKSTWSCRSYNHEANTFANHHKLKYRLLSILTALVERNNFAGKKPEVHDGSKVQKFNVLMFIHEIVDRYSLLIGISSTSSHGQK